jgi:hypothetical protein
MVGTTLRLNNVNTDNILPVINHKPRSVRDSVSAFYHGFHRYIHRCVGVFSSGRGGILNLPSYAGHDKNINSSHVLKALCIVLDRLVISFLD